MREPLVWTKGGPSRVLPEQHRQVRQQVGEGSDEGPNLVLREAVSVSDRRRDAARPLVQRRDRLLDASPLKDGACSPPRPGRAPTLAGPRWPTPTRTRLTEPRPDAQTLHDVRIAHPAPSARRCSSWRAAISMRVHAARGLRRRWTEPCAASPPASVSRHAVERQDPGATARQEQVSLRDVGEGVDRQAAERQVVQQTRSSSAAASVRAGAAVASAERRPPRWRAIGAAPPGGRSATRSARAPVVQPLEGGVVVPPVARRRPPVRWRPRPSTGSTARATSGIPEASRRRPARAERPGPGPAASAGRRVGPR